MKKLLKVYAEIEVEMPNTDNPFHSIQASMMAATLAEFSLETNFKGIGKLKTVTAVIELIEEKKDKEKD